MTHYYLDIETFGTGERPNPKTDKIITITFCAIDPKTGKQLQPPIILKEWDSSEKAIVQQFHERIKGKPFDFIPVGFNALFDLWFLKEKFNKYCNTKLDDSFYMEKPFIDLKQIMVFQNNGQFKGVRIGAEGNPLREWYQLEDFESIERYVNDKLEKFLEAWKQCL